MPCFQTSPRPGGFASLTAATGKDGHWGCYSYDKYHGTDKDKGTGAVTITTNIMPYGGQGLRLKCLVEDGKGEVKSV